MFATPRHDISKFGGLGPILKNNHLEMIFSLRRSGVYQ